MARSETARFFILVICLGFLGCFPVRKRANSITIESGQLPPDMRRESFTLIAFKSGSRYYDRKLTELFEKYTGKYVLTTRGELEGKYMNADKFRYVLDFDRKDVWKDVGGRTEYEAHYRCYILDRKENKKYYRKNYYSMIYQELEAYLVAIDAIRRH